MLFLQRYNSDKFSSTPFGVAVSASLQQKWAKCSEGVCVSVGGCCDEVWSTVEVVGCLHAGSLAPLLMDVITAAPLRQPDIL